MFDDIFSSRRSIPSQTKPTHLTPLTEIQDENFRKGLQSLLASKRAHDKWIALLYNSCWTQEITTVLFSKSIISDLIKTACSLKMISRKCALSGKEYADFKDWLVENGFIEFIYKVEYQKDGPATSSLIQMKGNFFSFMEAELGEDFIASQKEKARESHPHYVPRECTHDYVYENDYDIKSNPSKNRHKEIALPSTAQGAARQGSGVSLSKRVVSSVNTKIERSEPKLLPPDPVKSGFRDVTSALAKEHAANPLEVSRILTPWLLAATKFGCASEVLEVLECQSYEEVQFDADICWAEPDQISNQFPDLIKTIDWCLNFVMRDSKELDIRWWLALEQSLIDVHESYQESFRKLLDKFHPNTSKGNLGAL